MCPSRALSAALAVLMLSSAIAAAAAQATDVCTGVALSPTWSTLKIDDWAETQPDDNIQPEDEDCVLITKQYADIPGWHDRYCTDARYFICKLPNPPLVGNTTKPTSPSPGNNGTDPTTPANPGSDNKGDLSKLLPSVLVPVLTGLGALATISYTAWKWYHKRKAAKMAAEKLGELGGAAPSMGAQSGSMPSMGAQSASAQSMGGGMSNGGASGYGSVV